MKKIASALSVMKKSRGLAAKTLILGSLVVTLTGAEQCPPTTPPPPPSGSRALCRCECSDVCFTRREFSGSDTYSSRCEYTKPVPLNECSICLGTTAQADPGQSCSDYCSSIHVGFLVTETNGHDYGWCRAYSGTDLVRVQDVEANRCTPPGSGVYGLAETSTTPDPVTRVAQCTTTASVRGMGYFSTPYVTRGTTPSEPSVLFPSDVVLEPAMSSASLTLMGLSTGNLVPSGGLVTVGGNCPGLTCQVAIRSLSFSIPDTSVQGHTLSNAKLQTSADINGTLLADGSFNLAPGTGTLALYARLDGTDSMLTLSGSLTGRVDPGAGEWHLSGSLSATNADGSVAFNVGGFTSPRKGDGNGDRKINIVDALTCEKLAQDQASTTPVFPAACDVNCNGQIEDADSNLIAQYAAGLISKFTCSPNP